MPVGWFGVDGWLRHIEPAREWLARFLIVATVKMSHRYVGPSVGVGVTRVPRVTAA